MRREMPWMLPAMQAVKEGAWSSLRLPSGHPSTRITVLDGGEKIMKGSDAQERSQSAYLYSFVASRVVLINSGYSAVI